MGIVFLILGFFILYSVLGGTPVDTIDSVTIPSELNNGSPPADVEQPQVNNGGGSYSPAPVPQTLDSVSLKTENLTLYSDLID